jgi:tRNA-binding protein
MTAAPVSIADFDRLEMRVGTIVDARAFPEARKPSFRLWIDFGAGIGVRRSSAQVTVHYAPETLVGRQVVAVTNLPPRRIAGFESGVLVLGLPDAAGAVVLLGPERAVPDGGRVF